MLSTLTTSGPVKAKGLERVIRGKTEDKASAKAKRHILWLKEYLQKPGRHLPRKAREKQQKNKSSVL